MSIVSRGFAHTLSVCAKVPLYRGLKTSLCIYKAPIQGDFQKYPNIYRKKTKLSICVVCVYKAPRGCMKPLCMCKVPRGFVKHTPICAGKRLECAYMCMHVHMKPLGALQRTLYMCKAPLYRGFESTPYICKKKKPEMRVCMYVQIPLCICKASSI